MTGSSGTTSRFQVLKLLLDLQCCVSQYFSDRWNSRGAFFSFTMFLFEFPCPSLRVFYYHCCRAPISLTVYSWFSLRYVVGCNMREKPSSSMLTFIDEWLERFCIQCFASIHLPCGTAHLLFIPWTWMLFGCRIMGNAYVELYGWQCIWAQLSFL